jgi:hypothetical protein
VLVTVLALTGLVWVQWNKALGPEGHYFDSAGVRIHYTDEGEGVPLGVW